jgi:3-hydroxybutyryl-CoA dehydrogenase
MNFDPTLPTPALAERCTRPFFLETLGLLDERIAPGAVIDRICRLGGGFARGPFEALDARGLDVAHAEMTAAYAESFGEPRWRPSPVLARMVAEGRLGHSSGGGFYDGAAPADGDAAWPDGASPDPSREPAGVVVIAGDSLLSEELAQAGGEAGWEMLDAAEAHDAEVPFLILDLTGGHEHHEAPLQGGPRAVFCGAGSLAALEQGGTAVGFHALAPWDDGGLVELTRLPDSATSAALAAERFFGSLGRQTAWVADAPGLVLGRIVAQLVNEAAFALGAGLGSAEAIDAALAAALGPPHGVLAWADLIGLEQILATLEALYDERREERYRPAPELTRRVWTGRLGAATGEGFYTYE